MNILVTGSNGLVGRALCAALTPEYQVIPAVRHTSMPGDISVGDIDGHTNWAPALLAGPEAVVHLAARVHQMQERPEEVGAYREVNLDGTLNLARQCSDHGVKRFVFMSTAKVMGEGREEPYSRDDPALPEGPYPCSKWEAEQQLLELGARTGMEIVILRPPLVYGPGVGANFLRLLQGVEKGLPLPFGGVNNRRSLVYLGNLIDAIKRCLEHPAAAGKTYLVCDDDDVSSAELIRRMASALGRSSRLLPIPASWLRLVGRLLGKSDQVERLLSSLALNCQPLKDELDWVPPYSMAEGLQETVDWYRSNPPSD